MTHLTFGFIGLGLIGGSIARALKANDPECKVIVYDADKKAMSQAYEENIADVLVSDIDSRFSDCDFVFLCAPVKFNMVNVGKVKPFLREDAILTDVGSVKSGMHDRIMIANTTAEYLFILIISATPFYLLYQPRYKKRTACSPAPHVLFIMKAVQDNALDKAASKSMLCMVFKDSLQRNRRYA